MLQTKKILFENQYIKQHIFDFDEEGTIGRTLFCDNIEELKNIFLTKDINEMLGQIINIEYMCNNERTAYPLEVSALFGSIKCFKYLMMNGAEINENLCKYAIAGGNMEIIHLIEQKGMKFENCLERAVEYHHFELFEWLNTHFEYEPVSLQKCLEYYNEPIFYYYVKESVPYVT